MSTKPGQVHPEVSVPATVVMEAPSVRPQINEYQLPALTCGRCGATLAALQPMVAMSAGVLPEPVDDRRGWTRWGSGSACSGRAPTPTRLCSITWS